MYINVNSFKTFLFGVIVGIVIASVGLSGTAKILDKGVNKIKTETINLAN
jgi:hypothetical protein